jgi:Zn-dependent protease with chaperone function
MVSTKPFPPVMIFSEKLYTSLNQDEFEWVALHESGHYLMWHNLKLILMQFCILILGLMFLNINNSLLIITPLIAFLLGFIYIKLAIILEYQADYFAVTNMDNPKGMITGNIKMSKVNQKLMGGNSFLQGLIIAVSPEERIRMAEEEIKRRKKIER